MYISFTKKSIIKALKTEPLRQGQFFYKYNDYCTWKEAKTCEVCAVGAVLRSKFKVLPKKYSPESIAQRATKDEYIDRDIDILLKEKNYLGALSNYFEEMKRISRPALVKFVEKNFPNKIEVKL